MFGLAQPAAAHGFAQRYDLPVPLYLYLVGAGATVSLTFVLAAVFVRGAAPGDYPRLDLLRWRVGRALVHRAVAEALRVVSVVLFCLVVVAWFAGEQHPMRNLAPSMVWVVWWVGLAYVCALVGNLWQVANPWAAMFGWVEAIVKRFGPTRTLSVGLHYPDKLGVWPSTLLFLAFAWVELVWSGSDVPRRLVHAILAYSALTWCGMAAFGHHEWLRRGEVFSLFFALLARFSPTEVRVTDPEICQSCGAPQCRIADGDCIDCQDCWVRAPPKSRQLNLRPFAVGLLSRRPVHPYVLVLVIVMLSTVTFDGLTETPAWVGALEWLIPNSGFAPAAVALAGDAARGFKGMALIALPVVFALVYWMFAEVLTRRCVGDASRPIATGELAGWFVLTLVPISIAYHFAHYLSFFLIAGQLMIPLVSDPLGLGWDLFGTRAYVLDIAIIDARFVWIAAIVCIVIGHVAAVYLAHVTAIRAFAEPTLARRSQYPMLVLMIGYTMISLWILSQPIVEYTPT